MSGYFRFKQFDIQQENVPFRFGTDSILLGAWVEANDPRRILDVGTGSGVLGLMLAQKFKQAEVIGIDLHQEAVKTAKQNFTASTYKDRVSSEQADYKDYNPPFAFDLIVSNPPYFRNSLLGKQSKRNDARHDTGLNLKEFISQSKKLLSSEGALHFIGPYDQIEDVFEFCKSENLHIKRICCVRSYPHSPPIRVLFEIWNMPCALSRQKINLYESRGIRSKAFDILTKEFYLSS